MTDQHDEWVELPNGLDDLSLSDDEAEKVKGGAYDAFLKLDGASAFLKRGSVPSSFLKSDAFQKGTLASLNFTDKI